MNTLGQVERIPLAKARMNLGVLIEQMRLGKKYIILEKNGIPVAGLIDVAEFEDYLERKDPKIRAHIRKSNEEYLGGQSRPMDEYLADVAQRRGKKVGRRARG